MTDKTAGSSIEHLRVALADLSKTNPAIQAEIEAIQVMVDQMASASVPEIAIYIDGGLVQEVVRANEAPFKLYIHDHDVEGTSNTPCMINMIGADPEPAVLETHTAGDVNLVGDQPFWDSLRNPVECEDDDDEEE